MIQTKKLLQATMTAGFLLTITIAYSQNMQAIDLQKLVKNKAIDVFNRELSLINDGNHVGIRLSKDEGEGVAWLRGIEFSNGILEFDVRGEDVQNHSFVGIAFHAVEGCPLVGQPKLPQLTIEFR